MNQKNLISIIIPVFNAEKFLDKCISSVLNQIFTNFELILINDGSTDKSGQICNLYAIKDKRVRIFHQQNKGVSSARNVGIDMAKGKYICFIDADDWVGINYLSDFDLNLNVDLQIQGVIIYCEDSQKEEYIRFSENERYSRNTITQAIELIEKNKLIRSPWVKLFTTHIIKINLIKFNQSISYGEDYLFVLEYLTYTSTIYLHKTLNYNYIERGKQSLSNQFVEFKKMFLFFEHIQVMSQIIKETHSTFSKSYFRITNQRDTNYLTNMIVSLYDKRGREKHKERVQSLKILKRKMNEIYKSNDIGFIQKVSRFILKYFPPKIANILLYLFLKSCKVYLRIFK